MSDDEPNRPDGPGEVTEPRWLPAAWWVAAGSLAAVIVGWGVVAMATGWRPVGDDAFLVMRARDVFSAHPPLLSTASSGGASAGVAYNHPGPIIQYLNAPFVALGGTSAAALANATLNAACVLAIAWLARRTARIAVSGAVLAATAAVVATMGSGVLVAPWNPHVATLPLMVACVALWAILRDDPVALPVGVVAGSVALQTHLAFSVPATVVLVAIGASGVWWTVRSRGGPRRRSWWTAWGVTVPLGLLSVLPPALEQLANGGDGNLSRLLRGGEFGDAPTGPGRVARVVVEVLGLPPWFLRGSWAGSIYNDELPSTAVTALAGAAVVAVVVATMLRARHRRDREVSDLVSVALVVLALAALTATRFPLRTGVPVPYFRWLWPLAALLWAGVLARPAELAAVAGSRRWKPGPASSVAGGWLGATALMVVLTLVPAGADSGASQQWAQDAASSLIEQAGDALDGIGPGESVRVEASIQEAALVLLPSVIEDLDARGIDVTMTDPVLVQQSGEHRRSTGTDDWVLVPIGPDTSTSAGPVGGRRLAWIRPFDAEQEADLDADVERAVRMLEQSSVRLGPDGRQVDASSGIPALAGLASTDPESFLSSPQVASALEHGLIEVDGGDLPFLIDVAERSAARAGRSISLWLVPGP